MKYSDKNIEALITKINDSNFVGECRIYENSFIRNRKMTPKDIILYELNKKGLTTKMEILNFNDINNVQDISSPGLFKQREKLNPNAFIYLMQNSLKLFYIDYEKEVKTYKGYVWLELMVVILKFPTQLPLETTIMVNYKNIVHELLFLHVMTY